MPALPSDTLRSLLTKALPNCTEVPTPHSPRPCVFRWKDGSGEFLVYIWTTTPDNSATGRPKGEHKSQIILPDTRRGERQFFRDDLAAFLIGWSPSYGVFASWDLAKHQGAGYSANIQVPGDLLRDANENGWAVCEPRTLSRGPEVRCAVHPAHFERLISALLQADNLGLQGEARRVFLESSAPDLEEAPPEQDPDQLETIQNRRRTTQQARLERCRRFASRVLPMYGHACAICEIQMNVIEAAHIVPVHDPRSQDEPWNGIALCRNHHRLFDTRILLADEAGVLRVDPDVIQLLRESGRGAGLATLIEPFVDRQPAILPSQYREDAEFYARMNAAFALNFSL